MSTAGSQNGLVKRLQREIFGKRLSSPWGIAVLVMAALFFAFVASKGFGILNFAFIGGLVACFIIYICLFKPLRGYYLMFLVSFFAYWPTRILHVELPITTFIELLVLFLFIGSYISLREDPNVKGNMMASPVAILFVITYVYFLLQGFNPNSQSSQGWIFVMKRVTVFFLFIVLTFRLINTPDRFRYFMKFWLVMSFITALYACSQQWIGYIPRELEWIKRDPHEFGLLFQGGVIRKFSFLDGVVTFGSLCGAMSTISLILALNEKNRRRKWTLYLFAIILFLGMAYSGTRTFTIMLPVGLALYILVTIRNKTTLITMLLTFLGLFFIMFAPIHNPTLHRMRTTFNSDDASLNVRDVNRASIQPYIYDNPFGGGIASSGVEGMRFSPNHPLAGFPPDSGLLQTALELGWIGLAITLIFYMSIIYLGIYYYFRMANEEYKKYILAIICGLFSIMVTLYAQATIGQMPNIFFIYGSAILFRRLWEFDQKEKERAADLGILG